VTREKKSLASSAVELVVIVAVAIGIALAIQAWLIKPYRIPSGSMLPTLQINQRVLVDRIGMHFTSLGIGDIIVFHPPAQYDIGCANPSQGQSNPANPETEACDTVARKESPETFIKRLVGLPGDRISIVGGHVIRNGVREQDAYIAQCDGAGSCDFHKTITVPAGSYFMMGDNRGESDDSRFWGPVPRAWIIGKAFFTYWPPDRIGTL
jgi:signal peptidase I